MLKTCKILTVRTPAGFLDKKIELSEEQRLQIVEYTRSQSQGANFYKHQAGRIGASQSKVAAHTNPALPSVSNSII